jgi:hypothetical protein
MAEDLMPTRPHPSRPYPSHPVVTALAGAALLAVASLGAAGSAQELVDMPRAVDTPSKGKFQICRSWVMFVTCNEYSRVDIPPKVKVGDRLYLNFGSNPKSMAFPVAAIRLIDGVCTLYTEPPSPGTDESQIDKLTVQSCVATP